VIFSKSRKLLAYLKILQSDPAELRVSLVTQKKLLHAAQSLHAKVYLDRGYISAGDLLKSGVISKREDPYQSHSQYFVVERFVDNTWMVVAAARLILAREGQGHQSFQTYVHQELEPQYRSLVQALNPDLCAEVSALVKRPGESTQAVLLLYRRMWQYAVTSNRRIILMSCDVHLFDRLKFLFGPALVKVGPSNHFKGHQVVPLILEVDRSLKEIKHPRGRFNPIRYQFRRRLSSFMLRGLPPENP